MELWQVINLKMGCHLLVWLGQIKLGIKAGYKETEIVEAVIGAVSPSLKLSSYLEVMICHCLA